MSEFEQIDVLIAPNGGVRLEVHGVKGPSCETLTEPLRRLLGNDVAHHERTVEFHEQRLHSEEELPTQDKHRERLR